MLLRCTRHGRRNIVIRDGTGYYTQVSMSPHKVNYGSAGVGAAIQSALGAACEQQQVTCDDADPSLIVSTQTWPPSSGELPNDGQLTFVPQGTFHEGMGANYVQALVNLGNSLASCQSEHWVNVGEVRSGQDGDHTANFCTGPEDIAVVRFNASSNGQIDSLYFSVTLKQESATAFTWCNIAGYASTIAGVFSGPLGAVFGIASTTCTGLGG